MTSNHYNIQSELHRNWLHYTLYQLLYYHDCYNYCKDSL